MFIEVIGRETLPDSLDRDDVEDAIADALGERGEITGAGTGISGWNLDVELFEDGDTDECLVLIAGALVDLGVGWVLVRLEGWPQGRPAETISG